MSFTRRCFCCLTLMAAVVSLSIAGADGPVEVPPNAIESREVAQELAVTAQRFMDSLDSAMQAKYLFQDAHRNRGRTDHG